MSIQFLSEEIMAPEVPIDVVAKEGYEAMVSRYESDYTIDEHFIHVRSPKKTQGWLLHITVVPRQIEPLLEKVLPELAKYNSAYKIVKDNQTHRNLNAGLMGSFKIGKVVTVYLEEETVVESLVKSLILLTRDFSGPAPLTDFYLSDSIYTRYGAFIVEVHTDPYGNRVRVIEDGHGNKILDQYHTPPIIPNSVSNPFLSFVEERPAPPKIFLLANKYMPVKRLKSDAKGDVWRGLYFKKWFLPKWCIIKQGRKGMFPDDLGRDARDRLAWQEQVNIELREKITTPLVEDLIKEEEQYFLVMENVNKAKDLIWFVHKKFNRSAWFDQPLKLRVEVLDYLVQILTGVREMHHAGYVHQDITGTNFMVTRRGKLHFIDLELAYSRRDNLPDPPFGVGTPGYMSPQQDAGMELPESANDIYSLGALMILMFTGGVVPSYVIDANKDLLRERLYCMIGDLQLVEIITRCLEKETYDRPDIDELYEQVVRYKSGVKSISYTGNHYERINKKLIRDTIQHSINHISGSLMSEDGLWYSRIENEYGRDVYPMGNKHHFGGLHRGVGGVIYALCQLQRGGFDISSAAEKIDAGIRFLQEEMVDRLDYVAPSMYYGRAGLAITISEAIRGGILTETEDIRQLIGNCFKQPAGSFDLIYGIAGQGIALIMSKEYLHHAFIEITLSEYANILIGSQQQDGSWVRAAATPNGNPEKITGFGYGIAGVVYFLLEYGCRYSNQAAIAAAERGLDYLIKKAIHVDGHLAWENSNLEKAKGSWWCKGAPGISLAFLKAYELRNNPKYLKIAEQALLMHPKHMVYHKLGQCHGLSGLGEIYLEAFRVTGNVEWYERAAWLGNLLVHLRKQPSPETVYWLTERSDLPTADLMIGNTGILHFLQRLLSPEKIGFLLLPSKL